MVIDEPTELAAAAVDLFAAVFNTLPDQQKREHATRLLAELNPTREKDPS